MPKLSNCHRFATTAQRKYIVSHLAAIRLLSNRGETAPAYGLMTFSNRKYFRFPFFKALLFPTVRAAQLSLLASSCFFMISRTFSTMRFKASFIAANPLNFYCAMVPRGDFVEWPFSPRPPYSKSRFKF